MSYEDPIFISREGYERMLWNLTLFSDRKSAAGGFIYFEYVDGWLMGTASDDYIIITDKTQINSDEPRKHQQNGLAAKVAMTDAKKALKDVESLNPITAWLGLPLDKSGRRDEFVDVDDLPFWSAIFDMEDSFIANGDYDDGPEPFALRPERFSKFSRIRPGEYPIDFRTGHIAVPAGARRQALQFKAGPTVRGVLAPILRSRLREEFVEEPEVLW
jgi:hypothetical protein